MKKFISLTILFVMMLLPVFVLAEGPALRAPHALLVEAETGNVLWAHHAEERVYPASTTKILTVLLALEKAEEDAAANGISVEDQLNTYIEVSASACNVPLDSSLMGLKPGEQITIHNCIMGTMLISGNEAANVLGEYVSGDLNAFSEKMNARARELGAKDTHFVNANGYYDEFHYTTPADMAKIMCAAIKHDVFRQVISTSVYTLPATNRNEERVIYNSNKLLNSETYRFSQTIGGKTGYTDIAKNCLVAAAEKEGVTVVSAVFEASIIDGEYVSYTDTQNLFRYAFDNYERVEIAAEAEPVAEQPIKRAKGYKNAKLITQTAASIIVPKGTVLADVLKRSIVFDNETLKAPLEDGAPLGTLEIYYTGDFYSETEPVATIRLLADHAYEYSVWSVIRDILLWILGIIIGIIVVFFLWMRISMIRRRRRRRRRRRY